MAKLLVMDKSCFHGIKLHVLIKLVKNYQVILPDVLCKECLISEDSDGSRPDKDTKILMKRLDNVIKAGAYVGYTRGELLQKEKDTLQPVDSIVDEQSMKKTKSGVVNLDRSFIQTEAKKCKKMDKPLFDRLLHYGQSVYEDLKKNNIRAKDLIDKKTPIDRLKFWLQIADTMKDKILIAFFPDISSKIGPDFYTWKISRLWFVWIIDWSYQRDCSGPSFVNRDISNDLYDIEYVSYLYRADGILTGEREDHLVQVLAKAAFPDKDVFSSIEDVPRSYRIEFSL